MLEGDGTGLWLGDEDGPRRLVDLAEPVGCLPLLERPYAEVRSECDRLVSAVGVTRQQALVQLVPGGVIEVALTIGSAYWSALAVGWLSELPRSDQRTAWAQRVEHLEVAGQATRHRARRVRRRGTAPEG